MEDNSDPVRVPGLMQWAEDLVCPVCFAALRFGQTSVECTGCARSYPVVDGIPVLIPQRAIPGK